MFINEPLIDERIEKINKLKNTIILLDNLRFYPEEEGKYINTQGEKVKVSKNE